MMLSYFSNQASPASRNLLSDDGRGPPQSESPFRGGVATNYPALTNVAAAFQLAYPQYRQAAFYASLPALATAPKSFNNLHGLPNDSFTHRSNKGIMRSKSPCSESPDLGLQHSGNSGSSLSGPYSIDGLINSVGAKLCSPHSPIYDIRNNNKGLDSSGKIGIKSLHIV